MDSSFESLVGRTITKITRAYSGSYAVHFTLDDGRRFVMHHRQDCCESVFLDDVVGDVSDVVGSPILVAEVVTNSDDPRGGEYDDSFTWTFYKLDTEKGGITLRWYGSSNGYYSERVDFEQLN